MTLYIPSDTEAGRIQSYHLSVQRKLTSNMVVDLAYVGNNATSLSMLADINQARPPVAR